MISSHSDWSAAQPQLSDVATLFRSTPYLIADGDAARDRFWRVARQAQSIRQRALKAQSVIESQARRVLPQFQLAIRSDLVVESNRMEGLESSAPELRKLAATKQELLQMEVRSFLGFVRDDPRVLASLGLYRAYALADEWARSERRPLEFELRQLHELVMPELLAAGSYKSAENRIRGSAHIPLAPLDTRMAMTELAHWFATGSGDAVLDAAVVHAWLTHIHPFDDGNGRMARLLANLALVQSNYPPLLLRSSADRGQYLDALGAADDGDILPLYDLFVKSLRRAVVTMEKPDYVEARVRDDLLATVVERYEYWKSAADNFITSLDYKARPAGWRVALMGYPSIEDFALLEERSADGNAWYAKLRHDGVDRWLLWFGYRSDEMAGLVRDRTSWPSVFLSERTDDPRAVHPFGKPRAVDRRRPDEISIVPGKQRPVIIRRGYEAEELRLDEGASAIAQAIFR